jgi:hypothetical protein
MQNFRIGSYAAFHIDADDPAAAVDLIKQFIANGQAVAFSGKVLCGYSTAPQFQDGVIYATATKPPPSGHGQLVVGYNDKVGTPGKTGELLIQNSFGAAWPPNRVDERPRDAQPLEHDPKKSQTFWIRSCGKTKRP